MKELYMAIVFAVIMRNKDNMTSKCYSSHNLSELYTMVR